MMRKVVALTMLLILATNTFMPGVAYALTAGPTSPEATSFEPVDTTDMVNLNTGSFTYNLPLLDVPGPEGGYPLSLSYHAGIQPDLDASWVGLGWTLNPGAINRNVNGTPDDWDATQSTVRDYWSGGTQRERTVGASFGIANTPVSISFGMTFAQDTYKGFGGGSYVGLGISQSGVGVQATIGISNWGDIYANWGGGIAASVGGLGVGSFNVNYSTNFESVSNGTSNFMLGNSTLGVSISSDNTKPTLSIGGVTPTNTNSQRGKLSTDEKGFSIDIPLWIGISARLGNRKTRYWSDETTNTKSYGSFVDNTPTPVNYHTASSAVSKEAYYDTYSLLDVNVQDIVDQPDPTRVQGGSFPEYDQYMVLAQGVSGSIRPYSFQRKTYQQSFINPNDINLHLAYDPADASENVALNFRFDNDFSNSYRQEYTSSSAANNYGSNQGGSYFATPSFDSNPKYGDNDGNYGYGGGNKLAGSKSVQVGVIIQPSRVDMPSSRPLLGNVSNTIPGFYITNTSGVTYHYALPAYANQEESYQGKTDNKSINFNRLQRTNAYAYTWYLTSITGPDFVDRNGNSKADEGDWGYYVNFEYGLWNENFMWRNPTEGFRQDEDPTFSFLSMGQKEVYYLNAIKTRTHTALFEKEERVDGKGASALIKTLKSDNRSYLYENGLFDNTSQSVMKLNSIYLLRNEDVNNVNYGASGTGSYSTKSVNVQLENGSYRNVIIPDYKSRKENVFDNNDISGIRSTLESKAVRVIDFTYDYSLCKGTANSFYSTNPASKYGKLTLKAIKTRGKGGADLLPATKLDYGIDAGEIKTGSGSLTNSGKTFSSSAAFEVGDLLESSDGSTFYGVVSQKTGNVYTLENNTTTSGAITVRTTKNPPYNKDAYDVWQMYKSNARTDLVTQNANRYRKTDEVSAKATDVWSLRSISGPYGEKIKVEYEANTYSNVLMNESFPFLITGMDNLTWEGTDKIKKARFKIDITGFNSIREIVDEGATGRAAIMIQFNNNNERYNRVLLQTFVVESIDDINKQIVVNITATEEGNVARRKKSGLRRLFNAIYLLPNLLNKDQYEMFNTGNIGFFKNNRPYDFGGGIRVKKVSQVSDLSSTSVTYNYNDINEASSSGVTTYTPTTLPLYDQAVAANTTLSEPLKNLRKLLYTGVNDMYAYGREVPAPGVFYEYVTVTNQVSNGPGTIEKNGDGKVLYHFEVPNIHSVFREIVSERDWSTTIPGQTALAWPVKERSISIKNFSSAIGNLKRTITYDNNNNKLTEVINNYLHDGLENETESAFFSKYKERLQRFKYQGFLHERYFEAKGIQDGSPHNYSYHRHVTYSSRETYPCIPIGTTVINYVNGTTTNSENLAFDFYSGAVTKTLRIDANGNRFIDSTTLAYRKYPEMGLRSMNDDNKNMLTQTAASYSYRVNQYNQPIGLVGAAINTWSKTADVLMPDYSPTKQDGAHATGTVWRPGITYTWAPEGSSQNGMTAVGMFVDFNWANQATPSAQNAGWVKTGQTTLYDVFSHALEASDMNEQYVATKMGYNHSKVMVSGGPAKYAEIAYSGAEDPLGSNNFFNGDINIGGNINTNPIYVHTGAKSVQVINGNGFQYEVPVNKLDNTRDYWASVWVKSGNGIPASNESIFYTILGTYNLISGQISAPNPQGWQLATIKIPASALTGGTLIVGCYNNSSNPVYFDDIRFHPLNAGVNSYVYDNFSGELTYILDNNNFFTKFEYDAVGRLKKTYKETQPDGIRPVSEFSYHYKDMPYEQQASWIATGYSRCVTNPQGVATGAEEIQEQDNNVLSATYKQKRWVLKAGTSNICVPGSNLAVYVKLSFINYYQAGGRTYADIVAEFYNDPLYTIPMSVTDYPLFIKITTNCNGLQPTGIIATGNGVSTTVMTNAIMEDGYGLQNCTWEYVPPAYPGDPSGGWFEICSIEACTYNYEIESSEIPAP